MHLILRNLARVDMELEVSDESTIQEVKDKVAEQTGLASDRQRLIFGNKEMENDILLSDNNIFGARPNTNNGCITMFIILRFFSG